MVSQLSPIKYVGVNLQEYPNSYFDLVYSYITFQHLPRPVFERYLGEIHRV